MLDTSTIHVDADYVIARLEEAGTTLLIIPSAGFSPRMAQGGLDFVRQAIEAYGWSEADIRPAARTSDQISRMDEAFTWPQFIPNARFVLRRIVGARCLVHPVTGRHLFPWRRVGHLLRAHHQAVQQWHAEAIDIIVARLREQNYPT